MALGLPHSVRGLGSLDLGDNKLTFWPRILLNSFKVGYERSIFVVPTIFLPTKANFYNFSKFRT